MLRGSNVIVIVCAGGGKWQHDGMSARRVPLPHADVRVYPGWLDAQAAQALHDALLVGVPWEVHRLRMFGRDIASPRLSCWIGDAGSDYRYSGRTYTPHPWPAALLPVRQRLVEDLAHPFNSVMANLYRDGSDYMGAHSDDEPELGPRPVIASLSLGAERRFVFKAKSGQARAVAVPVASGDLLVMAGETQTLYRHGVMKTAKEVGSRINLTFRRIVARAG